MKNTHIIMDEIVEQSPLAECINEEPFSILWHHWSELRTASRSLPRKTDLSPAALKSILPIMTIYDCQLPISVEVRLSGTVIDERQGGAITGINILEAVSQDYRERASNVFSRILTDQVGLFLSRQNWFDNTNNREIVSIFLPVNDNNGETKQIVSVHHAMATNDRLVKGKSIIVDKVTGYSFFNLKTGKPL